MRHSSVHARRQRFMAAAYLKNKTPHKALKMETPFKMPHGEEVDLSRLRVIGARTFVHIQDSRKLDAAVWEGKVCGYSEESKYYQFETQRLTASWKAGMSHALRHRRTCTLTFKFSPLQDLVLPSRDLNDDTLDNECISYDDLLRDVRDYTGVLDFTADPQVQALVDQIHDLTWRDLLTPAAPSPEATSPAEPFPGVEAEPS